MAPQQPNELTAIEALSRIRAGTLTSEALVTSCLQRIEQREDTVGAWAFLSAFACPQCPLLAISGHSSPCGLMSAIGGKADIKWGVIEILRRVPSVGL